MFFLSIPNIARLNSSSVIAGNDGSLRIGVTARGSFSQTGNRASRACSSVTEFRVSVTGEALVRSFPGGMGVPTGLGLRCQQVCPRHGTLRPE